MTDADVQNIVAQAKRAGRDISKHEAAVFLGAREILAREPENANALTVVENFSRLLETGRETISFAEFLLPQSCFDSDEEKAEQQKSRDGYLRAMEEANNGKT